MFRMECKHLADEWEACPLELVQLIGEYTVNTGDRFLIPPLASVHGSIWRWTHIDCQGDDELSYHKRFVLDGGRTIRFYHIPVLKRIFPIYMDESEMGHDFGVITITLDDNSILTVSLLKDHVTITYGDYTQAFRCENSHYPAIINQCLVIVCGDVTSVFVPKGGAEP